MSFTGSNATWWYESRVKKLRTLEWGQQSVKSSVQRVWAWVGFVNVTVELLEFLSVQPALETCMLLKLLPDVGHTERVRLYMSRRQRYAAFSAQTSEEAGWMSFWGHGYLSGGYSEGMLDALKWHIMIFLISAGVSCNAQILLRIKTLGVITPGLFRMNSGRDLDS